MLWRSPAANGYAVIESAAVPWRAFCRRIASSVSAFKALGISLRQGCSPGAHHRRPDRRLRAAGCPCGWLCPRRKSVVGFARQSPSKTASAPNCDIVILTSRRQRARLADGGGVAANTRPGSNVCRLITSRRAPATAREQTPRWFESALEIRCVSSTHTITGSFERLDAVVTGLNSLR